MYAVPGEKENKTGLLSYGNGDEEKRTHSLAEGRPEHYYNSLQFSIISYHFIQQFPIIFFTIPLIKSFLIIKRPYLPHPGRFFFYPRLSSPSHEKSAQGNNF